MDKIFDSRKIRSTLWLRKMLAPPNFLRRFRCDETTDLILGRLGIAVVYRMPHSRSVDG